MSCTTLLFLLFLGLEKSFKLAAAHNQERGRATPFVPKFGLVEDPLGIMPMILHATDVAHLIVREEHMAVLVQDSSVSLRDRRVTYFQTGGFCRVHHTGSNFARSGLKLPIAIACWPSHTPRRGQAIRDG